MTGLVLRRSKHTGGGDLDDSRKKKFTRIAQKGHASSLTRVIERSRSKHF